MRHRFSFIINAALLLALSGCGGAEPEDTQDVVVSSAAVTRSSEGAWTVSGKTEEGSLELHPASVSVDAAGGALSRSIGSGVLDPDGPRGPRCWNCNCLPEPCLGVLDPSPSCYTCYCSRGPCF